MEAATQGAGVWSGLSKSIAETVEAIQDSIVTVHGGGRGGGRSTSSGVVWRPGVIVTVRHGLRRSDTLTIAQHGEPIPATLAGSDAGTDLAVLRADAAASASLWMRLATSRPAWVRWCWPLGVPPWAIYRPVRELLRAWETVGVPGAGDKWISSFVRICSST